MTLISFNFAFLVNGYFLKSKSLDYLSVFLENIKFFVMCCVAPNISLAMLVRKFHRILSKYDSADPTKTAEIKISTRNPIILINARQ